MITKDSPIFDKVSLSDIFKKIYENSEGKKDKIDNILDKVKNLLETIADASIMLPIIKEVLEISVRNDEQLVKLAGIVQRLLDKNNDNKNITIDSLLPAEEKKQLLASRDINTGLTEEEIDKKIENLNKMVDDAKHHIKQTEKSIVKKVELEENAQTKSN